VSGCCDPSGYDAMFGDAFARRRARRYRRRGLDATATRLVEFLAPGSVGATVLEIGGGVGEIGVELLRRGAASVTSLELSSAYDRDARRLAAEAGVSGRVERRIVDIAGSPDQVEAADLVVLHRVVCCYPDYERLLAAAADRCERRLAFSHPPRNLLSRSMTATENAGCRVSGRSFRAYVHPPAAMVDVVASRGLRPLLEHRGMLWEVQGLAR
jgi:2-polyprenyl-3-methyl-5-hydroxy-6-metoxy-1,4-benzoquinol methylase